MTDLDFDELDNAVNSLVDNTSKSDDTVNSDQTSVPTSNISDQQPTIVINSDPNTKPVAASRSGGQFMDVVHPSSDMRRTSLVMPERNNQASSSDASLDSSLQPQVNIDNDIPQAENKSQVTENKPTEVTTDQSRDQNEDTDINQISEEITKNLNQTEDEPLESPFISGTKVEKRPLGAFSNDLSNQPSETVDSQDGQIDNTLNKSEENKSDLTEADESSLPEELDNDLLKVESDSLLITKNGVPKPKDVIESTSSVKNETPTDIVQQYQEKPSTRDQNSGAIYDTESYHKGLANPIKKKFNWIWVVWIAIIVIVGVGVGAVIYLFMKNP